jgi:uncharacterized protein
MYKTVKTRIDLVKYRKTYDTFNDGHGWNHIESVRDFALVLAKKYCPEKLEIVWVAATLHDIGISISRDNHEHHGADIVSKDKELNEKYTKEEIDEIVEAIKQHRASTGNPQTTVAKIISDADKVSDSTSTSLRRAYEWGVKNIPDVNHEGQLLRAAYLLKEKFGEGGTGRRLYFPESIKRIENVYKPIFEALDEYDIEGLDKILQESKIE